MIDKSKPRVFFLLGKNSPRRSPPDAIRNQKKPKSSPRGKKNERKPSPPRGQKKNERKPRPSRGKLSPQQIKEIDRQKAASRSAAQKRKVEQKKRGLFLIFYSLI